RGAVSLPGFLLLSMALIVALTGLASVISGTASSQRQGGTVGAMLMLVFGFTGGSFIPLDSLPAFLRQIAPVSPFYWGTSGYIDLIADGAGVKEILPNAGILAGLGLLLLAIGSMLLTRRVARGALA
ncbi:MAG: ABC transporter permease, partial [bacterium]|nr:ABC transporter permease [bacterium]